MKTLNKSAIELFNGKLFLIQMLVNKPKKLNLVGKENKHLSFYSFQQCHCVSKQFIKTHRSYL